MIDDLKKWIEDNHLDCTINGLVVTVKDYASFLVISPKWTTQTAEFTQVIEDLSQLPLLPDAKEKILDSDFSLLFSDEEADIAATDDVKYLLFQFGDDWYYFDKELYPKTELNPFKYLGKATINHDLSFPHLGVHGKYELCNGSRDYKDWVKKAKFFGINTLGICENQTLAGTFNFQLACKDAGINSIIGQTTKIKNSKDTYYYAKTYVISDKGWANMLKINKIQIIDRYNENQYVTESELAKYQEGIIIVFNADTDLDLVDFEILKQCKLHFQIDPVEWKYDSRDRDYLTIQKKYFDNYLQKIKPILISDSYYLDQPDHIIKPVLNRILNISNNYQSDDQYFKSGEKIIDQFMELFDENDTRVYEILNDAIGSVENLVSLTNFSIRRTDMHLPKYEMNEDEKNKFQDNMDLFYHLVEQGIQKKIIGKVADENQYFERLEMEIGVLVDGKVIDYFLILADIASWCREREYIPGLGRGSAAGSLVSYLLSIVDVDPIKYDLLFERFLNKARLLGGSLPDIDFDCPSFARQEIIEYMINKYGREHVAFVGTSQNFKLKSSLKDVSKLKGIDHSTANFLTSLIGKEYDFAKTQGIFELATKEPKIKEVIQKYPDIMQLIDLMIFQPRSYGIHAAAVIISPKKDKDGNDMTIHDYLPIRYADGQYITEWEKEAVEAVGMLKEDMLGLKQLDKIIRMRQLIRENGGNPPDFCDIPLDDKGVFDLFKHAITEDIFQFNTKLQKDYLLKLQPDTVYDLIAENALVRPGAMDSNSHTRYIKLKHGEEEVYIPTKLESALSETYGLITYQEQCMSIFQIVTDCDLNEADGFRKVISKIKPGKRNPDIEKYEEIFKKAYIKYTNQTEVDKVWDEMIALVKYSFNKSHATAYALTGYWACWYKYHYPVEFYTAALEMSESEESLKLIIAEINERKLVNLKSPDINKSFTKYSIDKTTNSIYWSLSSIKYVGNVAVEGIIQERLENGMYFSFEEFLKRVEGKKANVRVIANLIICGAFDEIEGFTDAKQRKNLLKTFLDKKFPEEYSGDNSNTDHFWILKQKELCGLGDIDFKTIYRKNITNFTTYPYISTEQLQEDTKLEKNVSVVGILSELKERNTRRGKMCQIELDHNGEIIYITAWNDFWSDKETEFKLNKGKIFIINGIVKADSYKKTNVINTTDTSKYLIVN